MALLTFGSVESGCCLFAYGKAEIYLFWARKTEGFPLDAIERLKWKVIKLSPRVNKDGQNLSKDSPDS